MRHMCAVPTQARWGGIGASELELDMVISHHVAAWNQTWVFKKSSKSS